MTAASRIYALFSFAKQLSSEGTRSTLGSALDAVLGGTAARACLAFGVDGRREPIAERGVLTRANADAARAKRALHRLCSRAATTRRRLVLYDTQRDETELPGTAELAASGIVAVLVEPVLHRRSVLAVLVVAYDHGELVDDDALRHVETVADLCSLALDNDYRRTSEAVEQQRSSSTTATEVSLLTAAVAHGLAEPTSALRLQQEELGRLCEQLRELTAPGDRVLGPLASELAELSQEMGLAIARLGETTGRLSAVGRRESAPERVDVSGVARRALVAARPLLEQRGVPIDEEYESDCLTVGRREDLEQVVLNLLLNAAEAAAASPAPRVWLKVLSDAKHVSLLVEDSGAGVPPDKVERIFQPFYTTKPGGRGAGLGLKIVSEVVTAHGGHIEVQERKAGGASFRVVLPRASAVLEARRSPLLGAFPSDGVRRLFVVDDDPMVSRALRRGLKPHEVRTASSASEAEMALLDPSYEPNLVVCDLFLPGTNGDVLHQRIRARRPEIAARFVFVIGAALGKTEADYLRSSGCPTVHKPIEVQELLPFLSERPPGDSSPPKSVRTLSEPSDSDLPTLTPPRKTP